MAPAATWGEDDGTFFFPQCLGPSTVLREESSGSLSGPGGLKGICLLVQNEMWMLNCVVQTRRVFEYCRNQTITGFAFKYLKHLELSFVFILT